MREHGGRRAACLPAASRARRWRERVLTAAAQAVDDLARSRVSGDLRAPDVAHTVQGVLLRLVGCTQAVERGMWTDDGLVRELRRARVSSDSGRIVSSLAALDEEARAKAPWSLNPASKLGDGLCSIEKWPPGTVIGLLDAAFSWEGGRGKEQVPLPIQEIGRLYEALIALHDRTNPKSARTISVRRKTTGSYYTPDTMVSHVTRRSLGLLLAGSKPSDVLALRVLDPAMGAGHFLIEALGILSAALAQAEKRHSPAPGTSLPSTVADAEVGRRWLVANTCLCGVDRDARAVELTRMLLWLAIGHPGPLGPGLVRRLRVGNSLVGCTVEDLVALPQGERMLELGRRVQAEMVRSDGGALPPGYDEVRQACDRRTSLWFDSPSRSGNSRVSGNSGVSGTSKSLTNRARALAQENQFFHWDLSFPDVFCDEGGRRRKAGGFDAIIGNPPYAAPVDPFRVAVRKGNYTTTVSTDGRPASLNTAAIFIDRAHQLLRPGGVLGFVVPNSILRVGAYARVRRLLTDEYTIHEIVDEGAPFEGANLETVSIIARKKRAQPGHRVLVRDRRSVEGRNHRRVSQRIFQGRSAIAIYADDIVLAMERAPNRLGAVVRNQRGVSISPNDRRILSDDPKAGRWMLRGRNLARYAVVHLPCEDRFLRSPLGGRYAAMDALFGEEKLLIQNIGSRVVAALSTRGEGFLETVNILRPLDGCPYERTALLVLLNSQLMQYYVARALVNRSLMTVHLDGMYTDRLPLPDCSQPLADSGLARRIAERLNKPRLAGAPAHALLRRIGARLTSCGDQWSARLAESTSQLLKHIRWGTPRDAQDFVRRDLWNASTEQFLEEVRRRDRAGGRKGGAKLAKIAELHGQTRPHLARLGTEMGHAPFSYEGSLDALADELVYHLYGLHREQIERINDEAKA